MVSVTNSELRVEHCIKYGATCIRLDTLVLTLLPPFGLVFHLIVFKEGNIIEWVFLRGDLSSTEAILLGLEVTEVSMF